MHIILLSLCWLCLFVDFYLSYNLENTIKEITSKENEVEIEA